MQDHSQAMDDDANFARGLKGEKFREAVQVKEELKRAEFLAFAQKISEENSPKWPIIHYSVHWLYK